MGIGLLSMPFAMGQSGWIGMLALAIATAVFCISGKLIVRNFEKMPPDVAHTYPALGMLHSLHHAQSFSAQQIPCLLTFRSGLLGIRLRTQGWSLMTEARCILG